VAPCLSERRDIRVTDRHDRDGRPPPQRVTRSSPWRRGDVAGAPDPRRRCATRSWPRITTGPSPPAGTWTRARARRCGWCGRAEGGSSSSPGGTCRASRVYCPFHRGGDSLKGAASGSGRSRDAARPVSGNNTPQSRHRHSLIPANRRGRGVLTRDRRTDRLPHPVQAHSLAITATQTRRQVRRGRRAGSTVHLVTVPLSPGRRFVPLAARPRRRSAPRTAVSGRRRA